MFRVDALVEIAQFLLLRAELFDRWGYRGRLSVVSRGCTGSDVLLGRSGFAGFRLIQFTLQRIMTVHKRPGERVRILLGLK